MAAGLLVLILGGALFSTDGGADQIRLDNGDVFSGRIVGVSEGKLILESASVGEVKIPADRIMSASTDDIVIVQLKDGSYATGLLMPYYDGTVFLQGPNGASMRFPFTAVRAIYPDGVIPVPEFKWRGRINAGASKTSGNTDTETLNLDAEAAGRGQKDRLSFLFEFNREASGGDETVDEQRGAAQYDRFVSKRIFAYIQGSAERDEFEDLNLRTTVGPGAGYQIIETDLTSLSVEAGPTYVNEDFDVSEDRDFLTGRWALKFQTLLLGEAVQLYHNHEGFVNLEETGDIFVRTRQGLRVLMGAGLNLTGQVNLDYDAKPAGETESTDTKYILSIGYIF